MFSFFSSKPKVPLVDFSVLGTDMHSHILPGIDDGAQDIEASIQLVRSMVNLGFKKLVATPHIKYDYYPNTKETIAASLAILNEALKIEQIDIQIEAAAEYYLDETFESKLDNNDILVIGNTYLLFEISFFSFPLNVFDIIQKIRSKGYVPVLAHPERYSYLYGSMHGYSKIKEAGCLFQMNTIALTGYYGKLAQKTAEELVMQNMIDFMGSDIHHLKHVDALKQALTLPLIEKLLKKADRLQNTFL